MKKLFLLFLILFSVGVQGKEKPYDLRVKVIPMFSGKFYVVQYKKKTALFNKIWYDWPVGNPQTSLENAKRLIKDIRYDDSVRVLQSKVIYINF